MKNILLLSFFIMSANMQSATHAENIPGPFWYSISERIIAETQQLLSLESKEKPVKQKSKALRQTKTVLKCHPKKEIVLPSPYFTITGSGIWIVN